VFRKKWDVFTIKLLAVAFIVFVNGLVYLMLALNRTFNIQIPVGVL
jgi:hypothetical protein